LVYKAYPGDVSGQVFQCSPGWNQRLLVSLSMGDFGHCAQEPGQVSCLVL
jgi:hypothetical protein